MDDAEGDRGALLRRCRRGRQDPAGARPGGLLPRNPRRGNRSRQCRNDRTGRRGPSGDARPLRCGAACSDRQLPGLQRPHARGSRGQHARDRRRVRGRGSRRHGRDQLLGRRPAGRSRERCDHRGGPERRRGRCRPRDLRRQRPRRLRTRLGRLARDRAGRDLRRRSLELTRLRTGAQRHRARSCRRAHPRPVRPHRRTGDAGGLGERRPAARRRRHDHGHEQRSGAA